MNRPYRTWGTWPTTALDIIMPQKPVTITVTNYYTTQICKH